MSIKTLWTRWDLGNIFLKIWRWLKNLFKNPLLLDQGPRKNYGSWENIHKYLFVFSMASWNWNFWFRRCFTICFEKILIHNRSWEHFVNPRWTQIYLNKCVWMIDICGLKSVCQNQLFMSPMVLQKCV